MNRERFPGLAASGWARLDGPAGTQMVDSAVEAMDAWMRSGRGANHGGVFAAAHATDELVESARASAGALLGAPPAQIVFGFSMTALTMAFAGAVGRTLEPGDEIVCTRLDHDANVRPWVIHAERNGATVRFADPEPETLELPVSAVEAVMSERTRWVAVTHASNAVGTIPDLPEIVAAAHRAGALVYVDAVHAAPHRRLDVAALGCDALACSAYKWFGPHIGVQWARPELLAELRPDKLLPSPDSFPDRWENGTLPFEALAGVAAAADYTRGMDWHAVRAHEDALLAAALAGLDAIPGVTVHGRARDRTATVMFTVEGRTSAQAAAALAEREVAVWDGNYYAYELERFLGLDPDGAVRAGFVHYNDEDDLERLLAAVRTL
ncbi:MAG: cysteine desulfurase-like protein [Solirubrobacteraceae bacterium]